MSEDSDAVGDGESVSTRLDEARRLLAIGRLSDAAGRLAEAREHASTAVDFARILDTFGAVLARKNDTDQALDHHLAAARIARESIDDWDGMVGAEKDPPAPEQPSAAPEVEAGALANAGALAQILERHGVAEAALRRAAALLRSLDASSMTAEIRHNLGVLLLRTGRATEARSELAAALAIDRGRGDSRLLVGDLLRLAAALRSGDDPLLDDARDRISEALEYAAKMGPLAEAECHLELAAIERAGGRTLAALEATKAAVDRLEALPATDASSPSPRALPLGRAYVDLAFSARALGRRETALSALSRAAEQAEVCRNPVLAALIARERAALDGIDLEAVGRAELERRAGAAAPPQEPAAESGETAAESSEESSR